MANTYVYNMTDIWANAAQQFSAIGMNVTDTASLANSHLIRLRVGSIDRFTVDKTGNVVTSSFYGNGTVFAPNLSTNGTFSIANTTSSVVVNTSILSFGNTTTANSSLSTTALSLSNSSSLSVVNVSTVALGNTTANAVLTTNSFAVQNSTVSIQITNPATLRFTNATSASVVNVSTVALGNGTANSVLTTSSLAVQNSTVSVQITNPATLTFANATSTAVVNVSTVALGNTSTAANLVLTTSSLAVQNSSASIQIVNPANLTITTNTGFNLGTSTRAANGSTYLPNGLLLNWGTVAANTTAGLATFTTAFTTAVYSVTLTGREAVANVFYVLAANTTTANVRTTSTAAAGSNVYYLAIGV